MFWKKKKIRKRHHTAKIFHLLIFRIINTTYKNTSTIKTFLVLKCIWCGSENASANFCSFTFQPSCIILYLVPFIKYLSIEKNTSYLYFWGFSRLASLMSAVVLSVCRLRDMRAQLSVRKEMGINGMKRIFEIKAYEI